MRADTERPPADIDARVRRPTKRSDVDSALNQLLADPFAGPVVGADLEVDENRSVAFSIVAVVMTVSPRCFEPPEALWAVTSLAGRDHSGHVVRSLLLLIRRATAR
jgi:hypothetical protein